MINIGLQISAFEVYSSHEKLKMSLLDYLVLFLYTLSSFPCLLFELLILRRLNKNFETQIWNSMQDIYTIYLILKNVCLWQVPSIK